MAENQEVAAGDVLVVLDDAEYRAQAGQAEAAAEAAQAAIGSIDSRIVLEHSMIAQSDASTASAQADLHRARQDYDRVKNLVNGDNVSRQRYDTAEADLRKAEAAVNKAGRAKRRSVTSLGCSRHPVRKRRRSFVRPSPTATSPMTICGTPWSARRWMA